MVNSTVNFLMHASFCRFPFPFSFFRTWYDQSESSRVESIIHATDPLTHGEPYEYFLHRSQMRGCSRWEKCCALIKHCWVRQHQVINIIHDIFSRRLHLQCDELSQAGGPARLGDADASCGAEESACRALEGDSVIIIPVRCLFRAITAYPAITLAS